MIYIVGGEGFVGSAFARLCAAEGTPHRVVTRDNVADLAGSSCDVLVNADGNSSKVRAERDPQGDFDASVRSVAETLAAFDADAYVYLSSGDVYPDPSRPETTAEDGLIEVGRLSRYALHKFLAEQLVRGAHPRWLIFRICGLVGQGLRKNAVYDILHDETVWLSPQSELQFVSTDNAARLAMGIVRSGVRREIVNLGARGRVRLGALMGRIGSTSPISPSAPAIRYELSLDKLARLATGPLPESEADVARFVRRYRAAAGNDAAQRS